MDPNKLNRDRKHILKKYREKGFHFVGVRTRKLEGASGIILRIEVVEGPQVYFGEISVEGTDAFEEDTVISYMESAPSWFWGSSYYRKDRLMKDLDRIKSFYRGRGYLDATVNLSKVRFSASKEYAFVTIEVEEGPQYDIDQIQFEGNTVFERTELLNETVLRPGDKFRLNDVSADQRSLKLLYGENSYIDTRVDWSYQILGDSNSVRLVYQITERGKTRTGKIEISGNTKTREKVIRRQLEVEPGEPLNLVELRNSIQDLRATRYFQQVSIDRTSAEEPGVKDLEVKVKETSTGRIRFGGGFSSNVGLIGIFQISQQNFDITNWPESFSEVLEGTAFAGGGQTLSITLKPGTERSRYSLSFREPYLYDQPIGFNVEGAIFSQIFEEYDLRQVGGSVGLDYRFEEEDFTVSGDVERKNLEITDIDDNSPDDLLNIRGDHALLSISPGFSVDKRNQSINTTSGYTFSTSYQYTTGDFDYGKWQSNFKKFFPIYTHPDTGNHVLTFRARYGLAQSFDDNKTPVFDRFYAGGTNTVRGFDFRTISPREGDDVEVGGENRWITNLEYTFPLIRSGRGPGGRRRDFLRGALFSDAGTVGFETRDLDDNIRASVGVGIRFKIPGMGQRPFALDFGFPVREVEGDETRVISFDIGASF
jgi:outer membrane protein insertion porin family